MTFPKTKIQSIKVWRVLNFQLFYLRLFFGPLKQTKTPKKSNRPVTLYVVGYKIESMNNFLDDFEHADISKIFNEILQNEHLLSEVTVENINNEIVQYQLHSDTAKEYMLKLFQPIPRPLFTCFFLKNSSFLA